MFFHENIFLMVASVAAMFYHVSGALVQWLKLPDWKVGDCKFQRKKLFLPRSLVKIQYDGEPL